MANSGRLGDYEGNLVVEGDLAVGGNYSIIASAPSFEIDNNGADGDAALVLDGGSGNALGDAVIKFQDNDTTKWVVGNDNSASDALVISSGTTLGTNDLLTLTSSLITVNDDSGDVDFVIESNGNANALVLDAGLLGNVGQLSIGSAAQGTATAFVVVDNPAVTATSNQNFYKVLVDNAAAVTVTGATTSAIVASLAVEEPNITATGTVTNAATLYIKDAPDEGGTGNYALWVDAGASRFEGDVTLTKATPVLEVGASTDTIAEIVVDGGNTKASTIRFQNSDTDKWTLGNDGVNSDAFVVANSGALGTTNAVSIANSTLAATISGDVTISKATPILEVVASTDTNAAVTIDGGETADSIVKFQNNNTTKWVMGNDGSASDGFAIAPATLGTSNILSATTTEVTIPTGITLDIADDGGLQIANTAIAATATEINRAADVSTRLVAATSSPLAITTAAHDGKIVVIDLATGVAITLPAATGTGSIFRFIVKTTMSGGSTTIKVNGTPGTDVMRGTAIYAQDGGDTALIFEAGATADTITLNGAETGGVAGDNIELIDMTTGTWFVQIIGQATATEATPFSATVP